MADGKKYKIIIAIINILLGSFFAYNGWVKEDDIYLVTEFFCGIVMLIFGIALLFFLNDKKKKPEYKDIYIKKE